MASVVLDSKITVSVIVYIRFDYMLCLVSGFPFIVPIPASEHQFHVYMYSFFM